MGRVDLMAKVDELEGKADRSFASAYSLVQAPTEVHRRLVGVLTDIMGLAMQSSNSATPAPMRAMMRTVKSLEPVILEELANVKTEDIRTFILDLRDRLDHVIADNDAASPVT